MQGANKSRKVRRRSKQMHLVENCRLDFIYTVYNDILLEDSQIRHATKSMIEQVSNFSGIKSRDRDEQYYRW
jgi:uncharacterized tellurite resistance protein B-like protein